MKPGTEDMPFRSPRHQILTF